MGRSFVICLIANTATIGGYSQHVHLILILFTAQYGGAYYYLNFEGQESEAREIIKSPNGPRFTS